jgi:hypothetical protein
VEYSPTEREEDERETGSVATPPPYEVTEESESEGEPARERSESEDEEEREGRTLLAHALHVLDSADSDRRLLVLAIHRLLDDAYLN